jgi:hypothetical protein
MDASVPEEEGISRKVRAFLSRFGPELTARE